MSETIIRDLARQLDEALYSCKPIPPISARYPKLTIDDAYAIQMAGVQSVLQRGEVISGKKIGLTSKAMQESMGVGEPDYGHLYQSMFCSGGYVPADKLLQPRAEAEIAFVLKEELRGPDVTAGQVLAATDYVLASIEIVDSRIRDWKITLLDTVADNASSGFYVLGSERLKVDDVSLPDVQMTFYRDGEEIGRGAGSAVLGDPALCVAWLANKLWQYGVTLNPGEVILSGALSAAVPAQKGQKFTAEFSQLGSVTADFI